MGRSMVITNQTGTTMSHQILLGDCRDRLKELPDNSIDSIVTDPPYELGFMGKSWDASGVAYDVTVWQECLRVLKPGGHLLSFGGSRTYHRMACAIEDAGFQIRDQIMWVYGSGFPKSLNISKAIDKAAGVQFNAKPASGVGFMNNNDDGYNTTLNQLVQVGESTAEAKEWDGWGTALKPAHEPIVLARKPLVGTVANNVLTHGTGGINIDGCRVGMSDADKAKSLNNWKPQGYELKESIYEFGTEVVTTEQSQQGRFPANFIHDGSDEVLELFPDTKGGTWNTTKGARHFNNDGEPTGYATSKSDASTGSAARFFYCAKASKKDRNEGLDGFAEKRPDERTTTGMGTFDEKGVAKQANHHPTVKPTDLMRYLCRLITPPNGTVLDPFTGSGSTGKAAVLEGFSFIGVEQSEEYIAIAEARIQSAKENK
jgi:site-specific DNA-methyltransferase (adenine-specific)